MPVDHMHEDFRNDKNSLKATGAGGDKDNFNISVNFQRVGL